MSHNDPRQGSAPLDMDMGSKKGMDERAVLVCPNSCCLFEEEIDRFHTCHTNTVFSIIVKDETP
jgi:hypothetical protein